MHGKEWRDYNGQDTIHKLHICMELKSKNSQQFFLNGPDHNASPRVSVSTFR